MMRAVAARASALQQPIRPGRRQLADQRRRHPRRRRLGPDWAARTKTRPSMRRCITPATAPISRCRRTGQFVGLDGGDRRSAHLAARRDGDRLRRRPCRGRPPGRRTALPSSRPMPASPGTRSASARTTPAIWRRRIFSVRRLLPSVSPYTLNRVDYDVADLPPGYDLGDGAVRPEAEA